MSNIDIIRAWKDEEYRNGLSEEQRSQLPENPAGMVELSDEDMEAMAGGMLMQLTGGLSPQMMDGGNSNGCSNCTSGSCGCGEMFTTIEQMSSIPSMYIPSIGAMQILKPGL